MIKLPDVKTIYCDVDDTLVLHKDIVSSELLEKEGIKISIKNYAFFVVPNKNHIELLKICKSHGKVVVVWSQGGSEWAEAVVDALNLREYVDLCICKPHQFVDDLSASQFMPETTRIYIKYDGSSNSPD